MSVMNLPEFWHMRKTEKEILERPFFLWPAPYFHWSLHHLELQDLGEYSDVSHRKVHLPDFRGFMENLVNK